MNARFITVIAVVILVAAEAQAQIIEQLTPEQVAEAIALGAKPKDATKLLGRYVLRDRGRMIGIVTTPFSRVVALAREAHEVYKPLTPETVPATALAPEVRIYAGPQRVSKEGGTDLANVRAIVLAPRMSKTREGIVQPTSTEPSVERYTNLFGAEWNRVGMTAVFPIAEYTNRREVRVVFDRQIDTYGMFRCEDCRAEIVYGLLR